MPNINQKEAILLATANAIEGATVQEVFQALRYRVAFMVRGEAHWLETARGDLAEFASVDAAITRCRNVYAHLPVSRKPCVMVEFL